MFFQFDLFEFGGAALEFCSFCLFAFLLCFGFALAGEFAEAIEGFFGE